MIQVKETVFHWIDSLTNLIYPKLCAGCDNALLEHENVICLECESQLPIAPFIRHAENPVSRLFKGRVKLELGTCLLIFSKEGLSQKLIHKLKYKNRTDVGEYLGSIMGHELNEIEKPDCIIPIPLHPKKLKIRGYNQSYHIAKGLSCSSGIPLNNKLVIRARSNPSQTTLKRYERWENVKGIFELTKTSQLPDYVWLVDDTLTTGSTIEACASELIKNGVRVGVVTLAYAQ